MRGYIVLEVAIKDASAYERYKELAAPTVALCGGSYLVRGGVAEALEGDWQPARVVVLEFPSLGRAREWWSSPEYAPAKAIRQQCADTLMLLVPGIAEPGA